LILVMSDPFGEPPPPWWRGMWGGEGSGRAPKRYTVLAGALGPIGGFMLPKLHLVDHTTRGMLGLTLLAVPPALVETWWKRRQRRADEQLLVLPNERA
jgi:hypothetical protein